MVSNIYINTYLSQWKLDGNKRQIYRLHNLRLKQNVKNGLVSVDICMTNWCNFWNVITHTYLVVQWNIFYLPMKNIA